MVKNILKTIVIEVKIILSHLNTLDKQKFC